MKNVNQKEVLSADCCDTPLQSVSCGAVNSATRTDPDRVVLTERSARYHAIMMAFSGWFGESPCEKGGDDDLVYP